VCYVLRVVKEVGIRFMGREATVTALFDTGVQLSYKFMWFDVFHRIISIPLHRSLGLHMPWGLSEPPQGPHILGCCPWGEPSAGSSPLTGNLMKMFSSVKPYKPV
jgi:hypothetical protein